MSDLRINTVSLGTFYLDVWKKKKKFFSDGILLHIGSTRVKLVKKGTMLKMVFFFQSYIDIVESRFGAQAQAQELWDLGPINPK